MLPAVIITTMGLIKGLIVFGAGIYTGLYLSQNYKVPRVDEPEQLFAKASAWLEEINKQYKKSGGGDKSG